MEQAYLRDIIHRYESATFTVNRKINALIRDLMPDQLTLDQYSTLRYIQERGKCTSSELADTFCVGKSSITAIITRLTDKGLLLRIPDDRDRRVIYLALTSEGAELALMMDRKIQELLAPYLNQFNREDAERFIGTLEKLAAILVEP